MKLSATPASERTELYPVLLSEWTKLRTVRSTRWTLAVAYAVTVLLGVGLCLLTRISVADLDAADRAALDPTATSLAALGLGQLAVVVFAVLAISVEYGTGTLAGSLLAVPRRGVLFGCKAAVVGGLALLVGWATTATAFFAGQLVLGPYGVPVGAPGALRAVLGAGLATALLALFAYGVAAALRSAVLSLGLLTPFFFLVSPLLAALPSTARFAAYLPDAAGSRIALSSPVPGGPGPWEGLAVLSLWAAGAVVIGYTCLRVRDARTG